MPQEEPNPLMRKKKTPEELAAEAEQEELDDFTSKPCPFVFLRVLSELNSNYQLYYFNYLFKLSQTRRSLINSRLPSFSLYKALFDPSEHKVYTFVLL